jgi:hypothetical protein
VTIRLGIQNDLAGPRIGPWVQGFRAALPQAAFYIEPDYSAQMCRDLATGAQDFAILFTPFPDPDLHFVSLGDLRLRMVADRPCRVAELSPETYIRAAYSPALNTAHAAALPQLSQAPLAAGQESAVTALFRGLGGAACVFEDTARRLVAEGAHPVEGAPVLTQPVFAAMHLRHRTSPLHRALLRVVQRALAAG